MTRHAKCEGPLLPLTSPPSKRFKTRYPQIYYRLDSKGQRRYQISYVDSNGKRVFKTVEGNEKDARRELAGIKERMHRGERVVKTNKTVKELGEEYLRQTRVKESTKTRYEQSLEGHVYPRFGQRKIVDLGVGDVADLVAEMEQTLAANTIRNALKPLSRMYAFAMRRGLVSSNPVSGLDKQERPRGSSRRMEILTTDEIQLLLSASKDSVYNLLFKTAIFAGLRKGELLSLTWEDVDLLGATLNVREGKTEAAAREVVVPDFLLKAFAEKMETEGRVFPFSERNVNRALETYLDKAKVKQVRFHDLRHTFVSILISLGMDVTYIAAQAGHASPATTLKTYSHLFDAQKKQELARTAMQESFKEVVE